jgi:methionyl-tRNA formyltransferase
VRAVLVSRFPRVDTPEWKRQVADGLAAVGFDIAVAYSRATLRDQARAGLAEDGLGVLKRYTALRRGSGAASSGRRQTLASWAQQRGLPVIAASRLDDPEALAALRRLEPALLVLVGADIVPASMLAIPALGTINPHYGLLPAYRGMNVAEWSIFNGDPVGVTVHLVDRGIDTGDVLLSAEIALDPGETFETLRSKQRQLAVRLLVQTAVALRDGGARPASQRPEDGRQYYRMHPALRRLAEARLAAQAASRPA